MTVPFDFISFSSIVMRNLSLINLIKLPLSKSLMFEKCYGRCQIVLKAKRVQAALTIRGFAIRGFDYSRTRKQGKTANNVGKKQVLA